MKKNLKIMSCIMLFTLAVQTVMANEVYTISDAIDLYKSGNYTECYRILSDVIKEDPANALAYYYKGMSSAQLGKKEEAIVNYGKVLNLIPAKNNLYKYAKKGKVCLESPESCNSAIYENSLDEFIRTTKGDVFADKVREHFDSLKLQEIKREMNRDNNIEQERFNEFEDFSSNPTNDEIVAALRTLQKAGLGSINGLVNNNYSDLSVLTGNNQNSSMLNFLGGQSLNPQLIQALLSNSMTQGFLGRKSNK